MQRWSLPALLGLMFLVWLFAIWAGLERRKTAPSVGIITTIVQLSQATPRAQSNPAAHAIRTPLIS